MRNTGNGSLMFKNAAVFSKTVNGRRIPLTDMVNEKSCCFAAQIRCRKRTKRRCFVRFLIIFVLGGCVMNSKLFIQAVTRFFAGLLLVGLLLFLPAGTFRYPQAWLLLGILFVPMFIVGLVMMKKNPELLKKRLNVKEKESQQREVIVFSALMFLAAFILAGLSFRNGWLMLPFTVSIIAAVIFLAAYVLYAEVMRENTYLSRTVEVQEDQKVIDKGLYGIVRHPMYMATVLLFLAMPLVLGSVISFVIMLCYIPIITKRIRNEEQVLTEGLNGYAEYKKRVRYRLIPFIW